MYSMDTRCELRVGICIIIHQHIDYVKPICQCCQLSLFRSCIRCWPRRRSWCRWCSWNLPCRILWPSEWTPSWVRCHSFGRICCYHKCYSSCVKGRSRGPRQFVLAALPSDWLVRLSISEEPTSSRGYTSRQKPTR